MINPRENPRYIRYLNMYGDICICTRDLLRETAIREYVWSRVYI